MRVLYLNPFSQEISGPDESLLALLKELIPLGVEAHLVLPTRGPQVARYEKLGVKVHLAPISILKRSLTPRDLLRYGTRLTRGAFEVARIARRERIDLIHTNMEVVLDGGIAARLLRIPHLMHYRGNTIDEPKRVFDALVLLWTRLADHIFCISDATAAIFRKRGHVVETLYNPLELARFRKAVRRPELRQLLGATEGEILVGTIGRIHPRKDIETFIRTCALVADAEPRARFVVVGAAELPEEKPYEQRLRKLIPELGLTKRFTFAGARRDIPEVLKALDLFVLCSRNEGFGRVVAEAMAAGTPVVLSREGALPELVRGGEFGELAEVVNPPEAWVDQFDAAMVARRVLAAYRASADKRA
jgi:glycosyltransferase involved in cell wall biosynthesis